MIKNPETTEIDEQERPKKGKRKKKPTQCSDARRMFRHCGICGSENLVIEGVRYCTNCGREKWYLVENEGFMWRPSTNIGHPCNCKYTIKHKGYPKGSPPKYNVYRYYKHYEVKGCSDCGAVKGPLCPNCRRPLWFGKFQKHCKNCGYKFKYKLKEN